LKNSQDPEREMSEKIDPEKGVFSFSEKIDPEKDVF